MRESDEVVVKRERSMPVQGRIDLVELAELDRYFSVSGCQVRTMSQLLNWGISLLVEVLEANKALPTKFESLVEAHKYLSVRGLYQPSMMKLSRKKLGTALRFESMREEGVEPRSYARQQFNTIHGDEDKGRGDKGLIPFEGKVVSGKEDEEMHYKDEIEEAWKRVEEEKNKAKEAELQVAIDSMKAQGRLAEEPEKVVLREGMNDEELRKYNEDREKDVIARENAPIDIEEMKKLGQVR